MITWIGLAHVRPRAGTDVLEGAIGAFVPVVGLSNSEGDFARRAANYLAVFGLEVLEVMDIEPWKAKSARIAIADDIVALVQSLSLEQPIAIGTFEAYERI